MCHAYVVWETREKGAGAREPLRFIPDYRWGDATIRSPATRQRLLPDLTAPGWRRPAFAAGLVVLAVLLPLFG